MIKRRVAYLSMIKTDSLRSGEGLAGMYRRYLKDQKVGGMGSQEDFKLTWHSLHHTMVVASMPQAAQQELYRTFKSYDFTGNDLLEFCENYDTSQTSISSSNRKAKVHALTANATDRCANCGSSATGQASALPPHHSAPSARVTDIWLSTVGKITTAKTTNLTGLAWLLEVKSKVR